jgi:NMD protein affecting ribosome stability and mRNA decay
MPEDDSGIKCVECKIRKATREDRLCDSCRFTKTLDTIIKDKGSG